MAKRSSLLPSRNVVAATVFISTLASAMMALSQPTTMRVDGQRVITDVPPITSAREAYVPLRAISDALGADTAFDEKTGEIQIVRGRNTLRMHVGQKTASLNGMPMTLKHAPFTVRGRTMVALSVVGRAFGTRVRYDGARSKIDVQTPGMIEAGAQGDSE